MTRKRYRLTLFILITTLIINIPYALLELSIFESEVKKVVEGSYFYVFLVFSSCYWVTLLAYYFKRKWHLTFYSALMFVFPSYFLFVLEKTKYGYEMDPSFIISVYVFYIIVQTTYGASFLTNLEAKNLRFAKWHGVFLIISSIGLLFLPFSSFTFSIPSLYLLWLITSILLILHFIYERNKTIVLDRSDEILND